MSPVVEYLLFGTILFTLAEIVKLLRDGRSVLYWLVMAGGYTCWLGVLMELF